MYWNTQNQSSKPSFTKQSQHSQGLLGIDMILKIKFQMCASSLVCINDACGVKASMQSTFRWERYCWSNGVGQFSLLVNINQFVYLLALLREESQIYCLVDSAVWQSLDLSFIQLMYGEPESHHQCVLCLLLWVKEIWWNVWRNVGNWRKRNQKYRSKPRRGTPQSWKCHSMLTQEPQEPWCGVNAIRNPQTPWSLSHCETGKDPRPASSRLFSSLNERFSMARVIFSLLPWRVWESLAT